MASSSSKKRKGGRLHLRLTPSLKNLLEQYAKQNHTTVTNVVVTAVVDFLKRANGTA